MSSVDLYEWTLSKKVLAQSHISRAILNRHIKFGMLPRPIVKNPGSSLKAVRQFGYFLLEVLVRISKVRQLKLGNQTIDEIAAKFKIMDEKMEIHGDTIESRTTHHKVRAGDAASEDSRLELDQDSDIYVYKLDPFTHELLNDNQAVKMACGSDDLENKCFQVVCGLDLPCETCDMPDPVAGPSPVSKIRSYSNPKLGRRFQGFYRVIPWPVAGMVRSEMSVDAKVRNEAETAFQHRRFLEKILSDISIRSVLTDDVLPFLKDCLNILGTALEAADAHLFCYHAETESLESMVEWDRNNENSPHDHFMNLQTIAISQWIQKLKDGEILSIGDIEDISDESLKDKFRAQNIRSVLILPIFARNVLYGFIQLGETRLDGCKTKDADILRTIMRVIGKTIEAEEMRCELRQSEDRYRRLVDDMSAMACRFLPDGTLTFVNDLLCKYLNKKASELIGANLFQFIPEKEGFRMREQFAGLIPDHPMETSERQLIAPDGGIRWFEMTDRAIFNDQKQAVEFQSIGRDITARKMADQENEHLQRQLLQAQKMEAIGTLAGGIAHDFNNILSSIIGYTEIAIAKSQQNSLNETLEKVLQASERARDLVQQILTFSRKSDQEMKPLHIQSVIQESLKLLRASLPSTLTMRQNIHVEPIVIQANATQMHQVLMNLLTNAAQAVGSKSGTIEVEVVKVDHTVVNAAFHSDLPSGDYVQIGIRDTGCGMPQDVVHKIFDPYFTTKDMGTGLGLAVVQSIVKSHRGMIRVESAPGIGSVFYVCLPCSNEEKYGLDAVKDANPPSGTERILFVDDEPNIAEIAQCALEYLGYRVETCTDSCKALEIFQKSPDGFDLVITDLTMPGMTGDVLASKILSASPAVPVVLCTGYSDQINEHKALAMGIRKFYYKPISLGNLARCVREALNSRK